MEISIRKATSEDYGPLCELFDEVNALHCSNIPYIFHQLNNPVWEEEHYLELIADENVGMHVAETDRKLIGFVHVVVKETPAIPILVHRRYAVVESIGVKAEYQKQGVGQMLMGAVDKWATAEGVQSIELNVYEFNNSAIAFYDGLGYETLSRKMSKVLQSG